MNNEAARELALDRLTAMLPRAREILEEMAASPNKRRAENARKMLARYEDVVARSTKEQEGAHTRAAS